MDLLGQILSVGYHPTAPPVAIYSSEHGRPNPKIEGLAMFYFPEFLDRLSEEGITVDRDSKLWAKFMGYLSAPGRRNSLIAPLLEITKERGSIAYLSDGTDYYLRLIAKDSLENGVNVRFCHDRSDNNLAFAGDVLEIMQSVYEKYGKKVSATDPKLCLQFF